MKRKFLLLILTIITAFCLFAGVAACDNDSGSDVTSSSSSSESSSSDSTSSGSSSSGSSSSDSTSSGSSSSDSTSSDSTSSGSSSSGSTSSDSTSSGSSSSDSTSSDSTSSGSSSSDSTSSDSSSTDSSSTDSSGGGSGDEPTVDPTTYTVTLAVSYSGSGTAGSVAYGTEATDNKYEENTTLTITATANTGYEFVGWYTDLEQDAVSTNASCEITVTADVTYTALFKATQYNVIFKAGDTEVSTVTYTVEDTTITAPAVPDKTGYTGVWESYTLTYGDDVTVNAVYTANDCTVTYVYNNGSESTNETVKYDGTVTKPADPAKTGSTFNGWYTDEECTKSYDFTATVTGDITLYAGWTVNTYTVTFVNNNGTDNTEKAVEYNGTVTADTITYTGNTFIGWYTDADFTNAYDFDTAVTADITLYAKWEAITYTVTYNYNDNGTTKDTTATVAYGSAATAPEDPTYAGYTFLGWYLDGAESAYDFTTVLTEDITLTAKWEEITYTVTYNYNDNGTTASITATVNYGGTASEPTTPTRTGYTFGGWYLENAEEAYNFTTVLTSNITLVAQWTAIQYKVTFTATGTDSGDYSETVTYTIEDESITNEPTVPAKTGYTGAWAKYSLTYDEDVTVNAEYTLITYTVTFVNDDTTVGTDTYTVEDKTITAPTLPTKAGYTSAWESYTLTYGDIEVSVVYTEIEYTVSVYNNNTSTYITESGTITVTGDLANLYSGYTLIGNITIENGTTISSASDIATYADTDNKLTVYGTFAQTTATVNGVTYTFTATTETSVTFASTITVDGINGGYYVITGYTDDISTYYTSGNWLVLENTIDGYKVCEIAAGALARTYDSSSDNSLKNVVVPENIVMIGMRAFLNNKTIETIVFLADTVYFSSDYNVTIYNSAGYDSSYDSKNYPFYGCTTSSSDSATNLVVYFTNAYSSNMSSGELNGGTFVVNRSGSTYTRTTNYQNYTVYNSTYTVNSVAWTYYSTFSITSGCGYTATDIQSDVISVLTANSFTDINGAAYFYAGTVDLTTAIQEAVLDAVNAYTAETNGYINGYTVTVTVSGYEITVAIAANDNAYYKTDVTNSITDGGTFALSEYTNNEDGSAAVTYTDGATTVKATITNAKVYSYTTTDSGTVTALYVLSGASVTVTANVSGVTLSSVTYGGTTASGDQTNGFTFTAGASGYTITLGWAAVTMSEYTVTVYSDISYSLDGADITKGTQTVDLGDTSTTLDSKTVATTEDYYYFLGWAYVDASDSDALTFTSDITYSSTVTYYAIWGYNANVTLTSYSATSGSTSLPTPTPSSGTFYDWYTDSSFTTTANGDDSSSRTLTSGVYTYYARMQFTLTVNGTVTTSCYSKTICINNSEGTTTYSVNVLEGVQIYVSEYETSLQYLIYQYADGENDTLLVSYMWIKTRASWGASNTKKEVTIYVDNVAQTTFGTSNLFTITANITILMNY